MFSALRLPPINNFWVKLGLLLTGTIFALLAMVWLYALLVTQHTETEHIEQAQIGQSPEGLTMTEWYNIQSIVKQAEYQYSWHAPEFETASGYYWAPNNAQGWQTKFTIQGAQIESQRANDWSWGLDLMNYGYVGAMLPVDTKPALHVDKEVLTYQWDSNLSEWWINTPIGLEQGFTLQQRPPGRKQQTALSIEMDITGNLEPIQDGNRIIFFDSNNDAIVSYDKLQVTDANGDFIPANLQLITFPKPYLKIVINDTNATYPLTIDPLVQAAKLTASDAVNDDAFGIRVAISKDTIVVSASNQDSGTGAVYVFARPENGWATITETAKLTASDAANYDYFGSSLAISDDTIVVGAVNSNAEIYSGAAYIFVRPDDGWMTTNETVKLTPSDAATNDDFGSAVAINDELVVVGAHRKSDGEEQNVGAAYIYIRPEDGWEAITETAKLTASDSFSFNAFGRPLAINDRKDAIVVGASGVNGAGAVYVFERPESGWVTITETAKLTSSDAFTNDAFGSNLDISDDIIVAGAPGDDGDSNIINIGAAYIFVRPVTGWETMTETAKLTASDSDDSDVFGNAVEIYQDTIIVGAPFKEYAGMERVGAVYTFIRPIDGWKTSTENDKFIAAVPVKGNTFGNSVDINGDTIVVGSWGSAHVFAYNTLTIAKEGNGTGIVTSLPTGINCGMACANHFTPGTSVTLTSTADIGSTFTGWAGACSGAGECNVSVDATKLVTATFNKNSYFTYLPIVVD